jgi:hypothetical protein
MHFIEKKSYEFGIVALTFEVGTWFMLGTHIHYVQNIYAYKCFNQGIT